MRTRLRFGVVGQQSGVTIYDQDVEPSTEIQSMIPITNLQDVKKGGYCVGCGACTAMSNGSMTINSFGEYEPSLPLVQLGDRSSPAAQVCPFLNPDENETVIGKRLFGDDGTFHGGIGWNLRCFGGHVVEGDFRKNGTSGGMGTWLPNEMLRLNKIDAVIHVRQCDRQSTDEPYYRYAVSRTHGDILKGSKTKYHVVELSEVMSEVRSTPGRYLFTGVPCMCKAVRRLQQVDPVLRDRIVYVVSLVCGHLKSIHWTQSLAWSHGVHPDALGSLQYRTKTPDAPARAYIFTAQDKTSSESIVRNSATVPGGKYNAGALSLRACDYCDDVVGETADVSIGDAWLPRFEIDDDGNNLLIVRRRDLLDVIDQAKAEGRIKLTEISADEATDSQSGGFRQRREGLSYRLAKLSANGIAGPIKRVNEGDFKISRLRRKVYDQRMQVAVRSRELFRAALDEDSFAIYSDGMKPLLKRLRRLEVQSIFFRASKNKLSRIVRKFWTNPNR